MSVPRKTIAEKETETVRMPASFIGRYSVLLMAVWTTIVGGLLCWTISRERENTRELAQTEARAHFNRDQAFRHWASSHGGAYVPIDETTPPNPYLAHIPDRDIAKADGSQLTLMNPAYMVRQMNEKFSHFYGVPGHITSLNPLRPENAPDEWERRALEAFEEGQAEVSEFTEIDGEPFLRLMQPMIAQESCLKCHGHQGYAEGDVRGGVSVSMPLSPLLAREQGHIVSEAAALGAVWALGLIGVLWGAWIVRGRMHRQAEADMARRELEDRFRLAAQTASDLIYEWNVGNDMLEWYGDVDESLGLQPGQLPRTITAWAERIHPDDRERLNDAVEAHRTLTRRIDEEYRIRHEDGSWRHWSDRATPVLDEMGRPTKWIGVCSDVTTERQAEEALLSWKDELHRERTKLQTIFDTVQVGMLLVDEDAQVIRVNDTVAQLVGKEASKLLTYQPGDGLGCVHAGETTEGCGHAAACRDCPTRNTIERVLKEGRTIRNAETNMRLMMGDEEKQFCFAVSATPLELEGKKHVLLALVDITERKQAEQRYRVLFDSSRDAIMTLAPPSWKFTSGNPATVELFGAEDEANFTSLGPWHLSPETQPDGRPSADKAKEMIETAMREGSHFFEWMHKRLSGEEFPAAVLLTRMVINGQTLLQATVRDITAQKRAEEKLQEAKDYTENILCSMTDMLVVVSPEGRIVTVNDATCDLLDYSEHELIGQPATLLFAEEEEEEEEEEDTAQNILSQHALPVKRTVLRRLVREGAVSNVEKLLSTKSGVKIPVLLSGSVMRDDEGGIRGIVCLALDITRRKVAEERLESSEKKLRTITDSALDAVVMMDPNGNTAYWNPAAEAIFGYSREEMLGQDFHKILTPLQYREAASKGLVQFASSGEGAAVGHTLELTALRKDGTEFPIEMSLNAIQQDGAWWAVAVLRDITERKQAEEERERSRKTLEEILESMPVGVAIVDKDKTVRQVNSAALAMMECDSLDQVVGRKCNETLCPAQKGKCPVLDLGQDIDNAERVLVTEDKKRVPILKTVIPVSLNGEEVLLETFVDISERKQTEDQLRESYAELEKFNRLMTGREKRILELKETVNGLLGELGRRPQFEHAGCADEETLSISAVGSTGRNTDEAMALPVPRATASVDWEAAERARIEKPELTVSFIPIVCSAPLLYAHSQGYFARNGLDVTLHPVTGWSGIKNLMTYGKVDASHMLAPMPLACSLGLNGRQADIRLATVQNINGQALTLAKRHLGIKDVREMKGFRFGVPYRFSMHYYLLCYYLASHGVNPLTDVTIKELPPPRMPYHLRKGWVDGVFAPEPFNQIAVHQGAGFIHVLSKDIWPGHPCCSFAVRSDFIKSFPNTYQALLRSVLESELALHRASSVEKVHIARDLSQPGYLGQSESAPVEQALSGDFPNGKGEQLHVSDRVDFVPHPWPEHGKWILSQMQRWAQLPGKVDYNEIVESVFEGQVHEMAEALGFKKRQRPNFHKGTSFTPERPFEYMRSQPFCAYRNKAEQPKEAPLDESVRRRLREMSEHLAELAGGVTTISIEVTRQDELGHLEKLIDETVRNLRYTQEALSEERDLLSARVKDSTVELRQRERIALSMVEDTNAAKDEAAQYAEALASTNEALEQFANAAEQANQSKSEFLANMSHEIRTPMTAILGFADILLGEEGIESAPPDRVKALQTIKRNGDYLLELINDILDLSKIEAGKLDIERITCSPAKVVADVASLMRVRAEAKGLPLEIEYVGGIPETILCDPTRLRQILINLVGNAIKFTETGSVRLAVRLVQSPTRPPCLQFDVIDTGIGMTQEQASGLFQPFTQADSSTARKFGGTGLGLTISKRLAEVLGGDITISSSRGKGSTFSVTIETGPLENVSIVENAAEAVANSKKKARASATPAVTLDYRILLAEDGPDNQRLISFLLKKAGAQVTLAENGQVAYERALAASNEGSPFDVILMDMQMPIMDGYTATRKLREADYAGAIIALTANAMAGDDEKCRAAGCDGYATKPIDRARLFAAIAQHACKQAQSTGSAIGEKAARTE